MYMHMGDRISVNGRHWIISVVANHGEKNSKIKRGSKPGGGRNITVSLGIKGQEGGRLGSVREIGVHGLGQAGRG